jgi:hypothetical protein
MRTRRKNMSDLVPQKNEYTPTSKLAGQGVAAAGCLAGGVILLLVGAFPSWLTITIGIIAAIVGLAAPAVSKDPSDKAPGIVAAAVGGLFILSAVNFPLLGGLAGFTLGAATFGLFGLGIWKGIQFLKGLKARS